MTLCGDTKDVGGGGVGAGGGCPPPRRTSDGRKGGRGRTRINM